MAIFESTREPLPRAFGVSVAIHVMLVLLLLGLSRLESSSRNLMGEAGLDVPTVALLGLEGSPDGSGGASAPAAAPDPSPRQATPAPTPEPVASTPVPEPTRPPATPEPKTEEPRATPEIATTPEPKPEATPLATIAIPQATKKAETPKPSPTADRAAEKKKEEEERKKAEEKKLAEAKKKAEEEKKKKAEAEKAAAEKAAAEKAAAEKKKAAEVALAPSTARTMRPGQGVTVRDPKGGSAAKKDGALGPGEGSGGKDGKKGDGAKAPGGTAGGKAFGRADGHALGTASIGSNVLRGVGLPDYYCKNALAQLSRYFIVPPDRQADKTAVVEFKILRSGELTGIRVKRSSGDAELDQLALDAMKKAGKLAPLPDAVEKDSIETEVAFNFLE